MYEGIAIFLQFPWVAAFILPENDHSHIVHCQGSLITNQHIVTAAHCFRNETVNKLLFVVVGTVDPLKTGIKEDRRGKYGAIREIQSVRQHPQNDPYRQIVILTLLVVTGMLQSGNNCSKSKDKVYLFKHS